MSRALAVGLLATAGCAGPFERLPAPEQQSFRACTEPLLRTQCRTTDQGEENDTVDANCLRELRQAYAAQLSTGARRAFLNTRGCAETTAGTRGCAEVASGREAAP